MICQIGFFVSLFVDGLVASLTRWYDPISTHHLVVLQPEQNYGMDSETLHRGARTHLKLIQIFAGMIQIDPDYLECTIIGYPSPSRDVLYGRKRPNNTSFEHFLAMMSAVGVSSIYLLCSQYDGPIPQSTLVTIGQKQSIQRSRTLGKPGLCIQSVVALPVPP